MAHNPVLKENLGRIAAEKEKQLRSISAAEIGSIEIDSDEDYLNLMALSLDSTVGLTTRSRGCMTTVGRQPQTSGTKKHSGLNGLLDRITRPEFRKKSEKSKSKTSTADPCTKVYFQVQI